MRPNGWRQVLVHLVLFYTIEFTQPPILLPHFHDQPPPSDADNISGSSLCWVTGKESSPCCEKACWRNTCTCRKWRVKTSRVGCWLQALLANDLPGWFWNDWGHCLTVAKRWGRVRGKNTISSKSSISVNHLWRKDEHATLWHMQLWPHLSPPPHNIAMEKLPLSCPTFTIFRPYILFMENGQQ